MNDKELKILFLRTKLENESKNLDSDSFFNLLKDDIGWIKYQQIYAEFANNSLLDSYSFIKLTELGKKTLIKLELEVEQENIDKNSEHKKLRNDSKLSEWQVKTFWWIFGFAIMGAGLSVYNFIDNLSTAENVTKQEEQLKKMESELSELNTFMLNREKDSVYIPSKTK
ncbi:hypothetical protein [Flavobacterium sp.]|uniref:hypothetical protein n=1 Tax=Flavobacterium sp. TaxID=239 RepID=UPI00261A38F2|nr:hypothetical protein [Flavobacterium sp.]MDG2432832.1 hypothetical protein [Flavobacterium sp.]